MLVHAYLLIGEKSSTLEEGHQLAMAVNCLSPGEKVFCGECLSCRKIRHGNHPDVMTIEPQGTSMKIGQMREIQKAIGFKRFEGRCKVVVLTGAELLTIEAGNSLLKVLEDPPSDTLFILNGSNADNILPTILSRCQTIQVADSRSGSETTDGTEDDMAQVHSLLRGLPTMDDNQLLSLAGELEKNRENIRNILELLLATLRDLAVCRITGGESLACYPLWLSQLAEVEMTPEKALLAAMEVQKSQRQIEQKANIHLVLDVLLIKLHKLMKAEEQYGDGCWSQV